ncbi:MAG TPA: tripartite tricarboxylate transporter substrate binding protein [Anaerolineales bacterium]|nr:tripartite tricarboxylate transporter substrate binding protein [Anaerolineales bacterium]
MSIRRAVLAATPLAMIVTAALAQQFPNHQPIEMTVMFGAGSAADITARQLAEGMAKHLGAPVPVVNRTGAGGALGYVHVAQQKPDGYSIVWNSNSISTAYHSGTLSLDFTAFDPVARVAIENPALAVEASAPWKTLKDLINYAKANPNKVRVGNSGTGSHTHIASMALFSVAGAKVVPVPFGTAQAVVNLLGKRIEAVVQLPQAIMPHAKSGKLRVLAVLGRARDPVFPDVPTAKEQGYEVALDMWRGIAVPKGTPKPVIAKLQDAIMKTVESTEFEAAGKNLGFTPAYLPAQAFGKVIAEDDQRLAETMKQMGLKRN